MDIGKKELPAQTSHHNLILEDREKLTLTGVTDVDCFDERVIHLFTGLGELVIKGRNLHINDVSVESGNMTITGDIWLLQYGEKDRKGPLSLLGKLFRRWSWKPFSQSPSRFACCCMPYFWAFPLDFALTCCAASARFSPMESWPRRWRILHFCCSGAAHWSAFPAFWHGVKYGDITYWAASWDFCCTAVPWAF